MLAIVIPYYRLTFFEETLKSLVNQTDKNFSVYIGDDSSPDNCDFLLEKYKDLININYKKFYNNLGSTSLVNHWLRCLDMVQNESHVVILGDDDVLGKNCVEEFNKIHKTIIQYNVVRYATNIIDENGRIKSKIYTHPILEKSTDFLIKKFNAQTRSSLGEYIFKKEILLKNSFYNFPLAWHSDDLAILQCSDFNSIYTINDAIVSIRVSNESISGLKTNDNIKVDSRLKFCVLLIENYFKFFTLYQRIKIISLVEENFYPIKKAKDFFKISKWYLNKTNFYQFLKFTRRVFFVK